MSLTTDPPARQLPHYADPQRFLAILEEPFYRALAGVQDSFLTSTVLFWRERSVKNTFLPITTGSISSPMGLGSDSLPVKAVINGEETYLADSMQFLLEYACRLSDAGSYYVMPSFRGEDNDQTHLSQFFHSEAEIPGDLDDVMAVVEDYLVHVTAAVLEDCGPALTAAGVDLKHLSGLVEKGRGAFARMTFDEAAAVLSSEAGCIDQTPGGWRNLTRKGERRLMETVSPFVWVTHWDHLAVPFYQKLVDGDRPAALNGDLLFGPGEVVGAGERHAGGADVRKALALHEVDAEPYEWYLAMKDEQPLATAGFGLGIERYLMWVFQHDDIRDLQLVPRVKGLDLLP